MNVDLMASRAARIDALTVDHSIVQQRHGWYASPEMQKAEGRLIRYRDDVTTTERIACWRQIAQAQVYTQYQIVRREEGGSTK